jgi:N-acetylmuramoyl-L-alanine amidase CwlA
MTLAINKDYWLNAPQQAPQKYNGKTYIVIHNVGVVDSGAKNNGAYMKRETYPKQGVNVTAFVDDGNTVYELQKPGVVTWGAGKINRYTCLQVEQCYFSDASRTAKSADNTAQYVADCIKSYGLTNYEIVSHKWASLNFGGSDHTDEIVGMSMDQFKALVNSKLGKAPAPSAPAKPSQPSKPSIPQIAVDGQFGKASVKRLQQLLGTVQDGIISGQYKGNAKYYVELYTVEFQNNGVSAMVRALQKKLGVAVDGYMGPGTIKALQAKLHVSPDGYFGPATAKKLQQNMNAGKIW